jgi:hypothetical protein
MLQSLKTNVRATPASKKTLSQQIAVKHVTFSPWRAEVVGRVARPRLWLPLRSMQLHMIAHRYMGSDNANWWSTCRQLSAPFQEAAALPISP